MKGKGKGDHGSKGTTSANDDCLLQFPNLKSVEHTRLCPRYTSILGRDESDCVGPEEVDSLQSELETLLASVAKRMRLIQNEIQVLNNSQEKGKDKFGSSPSNQVTPPTPAISSPPESVASTPVGKRERGSKGKTSEEKPAKRMRTDSGRATYAQPTSSKSKGKVQQTSNQDIESTDSPKPQDPQVRVPKNVTPNRFWAMVEPYCADITNDDVKFLEDQIKMCEDIGDYMKIPSLGKHYSEKWAEEDIIHEQREGSKIGDRRKSGPGGGGLSNGSTDASSLLKRLEDSDDDSSPFGSLTQRLIQGLLEENIMTPLDDAAMISEADAMEAATISPHSLAKQLHLGNTAQLEKRIKKELEEVGILGIDDEKSDESVDDEILAELKKKQAELKALSHQNSMMLRFLHKRSKEEMIQQELRKKMSAANSEVIEAYRKLQATKAKKKSPTKKEKEGFYRALQDRKAIVKQLQKTDGQ